MSNLLKNKFLEKKLFQNINESSYTLIFHYNSMSSSEWKKIKEKIFEVTKCALGAQIQQVAVKRFAGGQTCDERFAPAAPVGASRLNGPYWGIALSSSMVIPRHIFNKFLKDSPHGGYAMLHEGDFTRHSAGLSSERVNSTIACDWPKAPQLLGGSTGGSSSLFFCQNLKEVAEILKILDTEGSARFLKEKDRCRITGPSSAQIHMTQHKISNLKDFPQFINLGLLCHESQREHRMPKSLYYNTYELHDLLYYTFIIDKKVSYSKFISLIGKNEQVLLNEVVNRVFFLLKILNLTKLNLVLQLKTQDIGGPQ